MPNTFGRRGLQIGLYAVLLTPLIFGKQLLFPFIVYRTYWFYVLIDVLLVLFFIQYRVNWRAFFDNLIVRIMMVFGLVKVISDVLGGYFWYSWWGDYERMMGLFTWLHLFSFFFLLVCLLGSAVTERRLIAMNTVAAAMACVYGLLQYWGIAFVIRQIDPRLFSTVGNPAFLAGYLLLSFWLGLFGLSQTSERRARILYGAALPLLLLALVLTATRGALLGWYVAALVFVGHFIIYSTYFRPAVQSGRSDHASKRLAGAAMLLALLSLAVFITLPKFADYVPAALHRFQSFSDQSAQSRLRLWRVAWQADMVQPFFGYGENQIGRALDRFIDPRIKGEWFDSSHNIFVDLSLAHGFIGLIAYLTLLFFVLRTWQQSRVDQSIGSALMIAAVTAYVVQGMFIFDTLVVLVPLIGIFAMSAGRHFDKPLLAPRTNHRGWVVVGGAAFLLFVLIIYARGVRALSLATAGYRTIQQGGVIEQAVNYFFEAEHTAFFGWGALAGIMREGVVAAVARPDHYPTVTLEPLLAILATSYTIAEEREGINSPLLRDRANAYWQLASVQLRAGQGAKAVASLARAKKYGTVLTRTEYEPFIRQVIAEHDWATAEQLFSLMLDDNPHDTVTLAHLAEVYKTEGKPDQARAAIEQLRLLDQTLAPQLDLFLKSL